jgi:hypothetical protein
LLRPNALLRNKLRQSFRHVELIQKNHHNGNNMKHGFVNNSHSSSMIFPPPSLYSSAQNTVKHPCLGLHVRHGDAAFDSRKHSGLDRSLEAHMKIAEPLIKSLGITSIFLATDDAQVVESAPKLYPQYHWYSQRRPILTLALFEVKNEVSCSPQLFSDNKRFLQDDIQLELAHLLADVRMGGSCDAIVGSFDSGLVEQMIVHSCNLSVRGRCVPSADLRLSKKKSV